MNNAHRCVLSINSAKRTIETSECRSPFIYNTTFVATDADVCYSERAFSLCVTYAWSSPTSSATLLTERR